MPGGLGISNTITPALVPTVTFGPTIGLAAGRIDKLGLDIRSFREPLKRAIQEVIIPSIRRNFDEGGRPAWEPLSDATLAIRAREGYDDTILVRTGALKRVATQLNIWDITTTSAVVRDLPDKVWYGKLHQGGNEGSSMSALIRKHGGDVRAASAEHSARINQALASGATISAGAPALPARPFLVIQEEDEPRIHEIFDRWLQERILAAGFRPGII